MKYLTSRMRTCFRVIHNEYKELRGILLRQPEPAFMSASILDIFLSGRAVTICDLDCV